MYSHRISIDRNGLASQLMNHIFSPRAKCKISTVSPRLYQLLIRSVRCIK